MRTVWGFMARWAAAGIMGRLRLRREARRLGKSAPQPHDQAHQPSHGRLRLGRAAPPYAATAASYGWINRALPADQLDDYVDRIANNIAALPDGVIEAAKHSLPADDFTEGLLRENDAWASTLSLPAAQHLISGGLQNGAQTPAGESDLEGLMRSVAR